MERINILDIIEQEIEGISLVDASRLSRRIMDLHDAAVTDAPMVILGSPYFDFHSLRWSDEVDRLIRENSGKIPAIKEVRRINSPQPGGGSLPLLTAKNAVEARARQISY